MTTQTLQQKYPQIYQEFFSKCQHVVSAPHSFFWTGDFSGFYGGLTISQKIPLRFYVGLQHIAPRCFEIERTLPAFIPYLNKFSEIRLDDHLFEQLNKIAAKSFSGFKLLLLSEIPLGSSLGGLGALSACLASLAPMTNDQRLMTENFEKKFSHAWEIVRQLQQGRTSGATAYTALKPSGYPIVFYSRGKQFWGKSLDELFSLPSKPVWPIDFGLIFSGNLVQGTAVIASAEEIRKTLQKRESQIKKLLGAGFENSYWENYLAMLNQVTGQNLLALTDLFQKGANERALEFFFDTLNQYQNLLHFLEISTPAIDKIYSKIHQIANKTENKTGSGCKITGIGKGGEVLFAVPFGQYREKIENCKFHFANYRKIENLSLDYASWLDGLENEGVRIEQDLEKTIYSPFIEKGSFLLRIYQGNSVWTKIIDKNGLAQEKKKIELLLDTISDKVYLKGRGLTSKTLPSQKATVEILRRLLESPERKLKNEELPKTYAENRYDLQSKITIPLSRLLPLKFEISGGMYENYILTLKPFDIKIGVLEKII